MERTNTTYGAYLIMHYIYKNSTCTLHPISTPNDCNTQVILSYAAVGELARKWPW